jgi:hypothetical protein
MTDYNGRSNVCENELVMSVESRGGNNCVVTELFKARLKLRTMICVIKFVVADLWSANICLPRASSYNGV